MVDNPPALEQHHCDAGANFVRIVLRPDACAGSVNAYRKMDLTTDLKLTRYPRSLATTRRGFSFCLAVPTARLADNTDVHEEMLPTKHSKKHERMQLIFVSFRLFSGPENFICHSSQSLRHPRHSRAELWEQRDRRKSRDG
jgi:hypothetical protein